MSAIPDKQIMCHHTHFTRSCRELVVEGQCSLWTQLVGHNPNTGEQMNKWACADSLLPILLIENSQQQRQTGAAVESFRNEMVEANRAARMLNRPSQAPLLVNGADHD